MTRHTSAFFYFADDMGMFFFGGMPDYSHVICRCYMCFLFFQVHPFQACLFHAFQAYPFQELILSVQFFSVFRS